MDYQKMWMELKTRIVNRENMDTEQRISCGATMRMMDEIEVEEYKAGENK